MRAWLAVAALNGFVTVALGAMGAHALRGVLAPDRLGWLDTGLRYHMLHTLALLAVAILLSLLGDRAKRSLHIAAGAFTAGIMLFSGGLYVMALTDIRALAAVVPFGGALFLAGWIALLVAALRGPRG